MRLRLCCHPDKMTKDKHFLLRRKVLAQTIYYNLKDKEKSNCNQEQQDTMSNPPYDSI